MAELAVSPERRDAGQRYISALRHLGLQPDAALWIYDTDDEEYRLVLVTEVVRLKGAAAMYTLLHKAHEKSGTPEDLSPWIVEIMDRDHPLAAQIHSSLQNQISGVRLNYTTLDGVEHQDQLAAPLYTFPTFVFGASWVYFEDARRNKPSAQQQWKRFSHNVDALAA